MESGPHGGTLKPPVEASTQATPVLGHGHEALGCRARLERLVSVGLIDIGALAHQDEIEVFTVELEVFGTAVT